MQYRRLGKAGLKVSEVSLGLMRFGWDADFAARRNRVVAAVGAALEQGVNHFDGAEVYGRDGGAELDFGTAIRELAIPRDLLVLSGKAMPLRLQAKAERRRPTQAGLSRKHLVECCDATCRRYGVDYLDLFYCHRPDPEVEFEEVVETMHELVLRGKILYWGTSHFSPAQIERLHEIARLGGMRGPVCEQNGFNLLDTGSAFGQEAVLERFGMGFCAHTPLSAGLLTGKHDEGLEEPLRRFPNHPLELQREFVVGLGKLARKAGVTTSQLALGWLLRQRFVSTVLVGTTQPERIATCSAASELAGSLPAEILSEVQGLVTGFLEKAAA